ncbi:MAG: hypothetical protein J2P18_16325, partial [Nocardia sp.]|nr:hypothetical protein [Nocardia sp.]
MSRNNELPMLPPWLSESDVSESGYEAPVQNLPHRELIPQDGGRRLFNRKPADERNEPDKKKRKLRRKGKADNAAPQAPETGSSWGPPPEAIPEDSLRYSRAALADNGYDRYADQPGPQGQDTGLQDATPVRHTQGAGVDDQGL